MSYGDIAITVAIGLLFLQFVVTAILAAWSVSTVNKELTYVRQQLREMISLLTLIAAAISQQSKSE